MQTLHKCKPKFSD